MLVAIVAGLIGAMGATGMLMRSKSVRIKKYTLGGEYVSLPLEGASKVTFDDGNMGWASSVDNYKGFAVLESDTARMTTLRTRTDWVPFLECRTDSGMLTVKVNYDAMVKEYVDSGMPRRMVRLRSEDFVIGTLIMPRGSLREVAARDKTLYLDSIKADEIMSKVDDRLVLNNSHIRLLNSRAKRISELKLDNSTVDDAQLKAVDRTFKVTCSDASVIDNMYIDSVYDNPKKAYFWFEKANIRNFKFNPDNDKIVLNVNMKSGGPSNI